MAGGGFSEASLRCPMAPQTRALNSPLSTFNGVTTERKRMMAKTIGRTLAAPLEHRRITSSDTLAGRLRLASRRRNPGLRYPTRASQSAFGPIRLRLSRPRSGP